jgi:hypothetical protein
VRVIEGKASLRCTSGRWFGSHRGPDVCRPRELSACSTSTNITIWMGCAVIPSLHLPFRFVAQIRKSVKESTLTGERQSAASWVSLIRQSPPPPHLNGLNRASSDMSFPIGGDSVMGFRLRHLPTRRSFEYSWGPSPFTQSILVPAWSTSAHRFCPSNSVFLRRLTYAPRQCQHILTWRLLSPVKDRRQVSVIFLFASPRRHLISGIPGSIRRRRQQCHLFSHSRNRERRGRGPAGMLSLAKRLLPLTRSYQATTSKYSDSSAAYWKLYMSEAEINDKKFIDSLRGDTKSMVFLVRDDIHRSFRVPIASVISDYRPAEHLILRYCRIVYHRNIQDAPP